MKIEQDSVKMEKKEKRVNAAKPKSEHSEGIEAAESEEARIIENELHLFAMNKVIKLKFKERYLKELSAYQEFLKQSKSLE